MLVSACTDLFHRERRQTGKQYRYGVIRYQKYLELLHSVFLIIFQNYYQDKFRISKFTSPFWDHSLPSPKARLIEALQNSGLPEIGEYSLSMFFFTIAASACNNFVILKMW